MNNILFNIGALEMALVANIKAGIESPEDSCFYIEDNFYVFKYPSGVKGGEIIYSKEYMPVSYPLKDVFDWVEECQNKAITI